MKLNFPNIDVEQSTDFKSERFNIGNTRVIMEILRGKMYSNPIKTICQEIMSNARDAHREVGKDNVPIQVKLPNKLDPRFWVKDFGPSITPDRMSSVFIRYGCSTKRDDNKETGGFGLGAKSPFAYTDTFIVISTTQEDNIRIKREYIAHIDKSGMGEMSLSKEEATEEPQGTTIILSIATKDFDQFKIYTKKSAVYWDVRPEILGDPEWSWPEYSTDYKGTRWCVNNPKSSEDIDYIQAFPIALIDGIPYDINLSYIYAPNDRTQYYYNLPHTPIRLYFKIGEIPVTANREDIDYQSNVKSIIKTSIEEAIKELQLQLTDNLKNKNNLYDAILFWQELCKKPYGCFLKETKWNNILLSKAEKVLLPVDSGIKVYQFKRDSNSLSGCRKNADGNSFSIRKDTYIVENDTNKKLLSRGRLASLFDNIDIKYVVVVNFSLLEIEEIINDENGDKFSIIKTKIASPEIISQRKCIAEKTCNWSLLNPIILSTVPNKKLPTKTTNTQPSAPKIAPSGIKKLVSRTSQRWATISLSDTDPNKTKYFVNLYNRSIYLNKDYKISIHRLDYLLEILGMIEKDFIINNPIYGITSSKIKLDSTWQSLWDYLNKVYDTHISQLPEENDDYSIFNRCFGETYLSIQKNDNFKHEIDGTLLSQYITESNKYKDIKHKRKLINDFGSYIKKPYLTPKKSYLLEDLYNKVLKKYPLVLSLFNSDQKLSNSSLDDLITYVKLKELEK